MRLRIIPCAFAMGLLMAANVSAQEQGTQPSTAPPAAPLAPNRLPTRIRVGENVQAASLLHQVVPEYPPEAKAAHITGTVVLHAIVGRDGAVQNLEFVSGPPELQKAAMDAVAQWRYRPTLLNKELVEVDTTVSVVFTLGGEAAPAPPKQGVPQRIRVGGTTRMPVLVNQVMPVYPPDAKAKHICGTVVLRATIDKEGAVKKIEFVSGPPELMKSAMDAVQQWRYSPAKLNGEPVEFPTTISVVFNL